MFTFGVTNCSFVMTVNFTGTLTYHLYWLVKLISESLNIIGSTIYSKTINKELRRNKNL